MVKARTTISIDAELIKQAQDKMLNISGLAEEAVRQKLNYKEVRIDILNCEFCGRECSKAFVDKQGNYNDGLTWLCPDEKWICPHCLRTKSVRRLF